jgi:hypothetical protein
MDASGVGRFGRAGVLRERRHDTRHDAVSDSRHACDAALSRPGRLVSVRYPGEAEWKETSALRIRAANTRRSAEPFSDPQHH